MAEEDFRYPRAEQNGVLSKEISSESDMFQNLAILLNFDQLPRADSGFTIGSDPSTCDITLGQPKQGVSARHLTITFNQEHQVLMQDWSRSGTYVSYGRGNEPFYSKPTNDGPRVWILPPGWPVRVQIGEIRLELEVPDRSGRITKWNDDVEAFREVVRTRLPPMGDMDMNRSVLTTGPVQTPVVDETPIEGSQIPTQGRQDGGQYFVKDDKVTLGKGGNGSVVRYHDATTWKVYAGKIPSNGISLSREVQLLKENPHPHIVKFVDTLGDNVLIMEYCRNGTLYGLLNKGPLAQLDACMVLIQCLQAMVHLHQHNVAHRDITPNNVLIRSTNPIDIALADFGWARSYQGSMSTMRLGTMTYRAPEIFLGGKKYTPAIDIWSLGIVATQCFLDLEVDESRDQTEESIARDVIRQVKEQKEFSSGPMHSYTSVISDMLSWNASERPSAEECLQRFEDIFRDNFVVPATPVVRSRVREADIPALASDATMVIPETEEATPRPLSSVVAASTAEQAQVSQSRSANFQKHSSGSEPMSCEDSAELPAGPDPGPSQEAMSEVPPSAQVDPMDLSSPVAYWSSDPDESMPSALNSQPGSASPSSAVYPKRPAEDDGREGGEKRRALEKPETRHSW